MRAGLGIFWVMNDKFLGDNPLHIHQGLLIGPKWIQADIILKVTHIASSKFVK